MNMALKIKELRRRNRKSQSEMAADLNKSRAVITNWERGVTPLTADDLTLLAGYFNISVDSLTNTDPLGKTDEEVVIEVLENYFLDRQRTKEERELMLRNIMEIYFKTTK